MKQGWNIFILFLLINLIAGGGRLPSSDETSIYLMTESIALHGSFDIPAGIISNGSYWNGKFYSWYEVGQALFAVPFYYSGYLITKILPVPLKFHTLIIKAVVSTFNALIGALVAVLFFAFSRKLGHSIRLAFFLTCGFCITTNYFPYTKSFMREPLLTLFLLGSVYYLFSFKLEPPKKKFLVYAGLLSGLGFLTKLTFALNIVFLFCYLLYLLWVQESGSVRNIVKKSLYFLLPAGLGFAGMLVYNYLRFADIFNLGYHGGTSFTTPMYVGLYGQLFSSGKSVFLYAPLAILMFWGFSSFYRKNKAETILFLGLIISNLILYSLYMSWAGEGSWGSRYLIPILPLTILMTGYFIRDGQQPVKIIAIILAVIGLLVQVAGTSIYFGNYHREIGEFPYKTGFTDPEFMYKSHFIPNYSPVIGHWRMLTRNLAEHFNGEIPLISLSDNNQQQRIPIQSQEHEKLFHTFDFWFTYPYYSGLKSPLPLIGLGILAGLLIYQGIRIRRMLFINQKQDCKEK